MREMIDNRITSPHQYEDLFSNLLRAREDEKDGESTFDDSNLMGNIFIMLFAGHETSANTLALALAFIAMYPEVQERFLAQIRQCVSPGQLPTYSDISKLSYGTAIMQETLRLIPIVPLIPKSSAYDTQFTTHNANGEARQVSVPAGTNMGINVIGLHYNPKYWDNPYEFRPERFLQEYEKFAWLPFSAGPRACIGRRFAEIEILAVLTLIVLKYEISVPDEPKFGSESLEEKKARVLDAERTTLLMRAKKTPLTLRRRR
ncbi:hypothetical protein M408DRAFT_287431 [Serendipita vermifera MAFF 305830]|uniref:Cytochrome P450 n=1 Tax=Serendipita vermifera MAFF 305830 TaxID=933852 RepID=A0A0C3BEJ4_SERVB|nr:hypothetical protein M408DRAFT_287431 [Serendipita vermifera MAFF 305830]